MVEWLEQPITAAVVSGVLIGGATLWASRRRAKPRPVGSASSPGLDEEQRRRLVDAVGAADEFHRAARDLEAAGAMSVLSVGHALEALDDKAEAFFSIWAKARVFRSLRLSPIIAELVRRSEASTELLRMQALLFDRSGERLLGADRTAAIAADLSRDLSQLRELLEKAVVSKPDPLVG